jgi:outer membrane protein assembly factor BamB
MKIGLWKKGLVLGIILLFVGAGVIPSFGGATVERQDSQSKNDGIDWWSMFRHDPQHSGYSTSDAPNTNNVLWSYTTSEVVYSSPAVVDSKLYIGSRNGVMYCLNASTGGLIWIYQTGFPGCFSSPAVSEGKIYITSYNGNVYCLDANTGDYIWNYTTGSAVYSSPAVADSRLYIGSFDNNVYCLDANTGGYIWSYTTGDQVYSSPAVADGKVYIGSHDDYVYCLDANTGGYIWSYTTGDEVHSSPTVADGKVYIGSKDNNTYCLNANTGINIWSYTTGSWVRSSPAVADGKVYIGSDDFNVYCLDADNGAYIWSYITGLEGSVSSSPAVADGKVYFGSFNNKVYCLDANTGGYIWSYTTLDHVISSPAVADGRVYIGGFDYTVYAFEDLNSPPSNPNITGLNNGKPNTDYNFTFNSTDPDDDDIAEYIVNWGDGTGNVTISGPFSSGEEVTISHSWTFQETFTIKAKAKDIYGAESEWSEFEVKIEISRNRATYHSVFHWLFERFPLLERLLSLFR